MRACQHSDVVRKFRCHVINVLPSQSIRQKSRERVRKSEVGGLKSEVRGPKSEVRGPRSEVRGLKSDVRCPPLSYKIRGFREGQLTLGKGFGEHLFDLNFFRVFGHSQFAHQEIASAFQHLLFAE